MDRIRLLVAHADREEASQLLQRRSMTDSEVALLQVRRVAANHHEVQFVLLLAIMSLRLRASHRTHSSLHLAHWHHLHVDESTEQLLRLQH